ncbi:hypothetical protein Q428_05180 [Fervidicella metallireducens AeB]|uniref:DUF4350 domain-containing protein n=1 Tax=Fervidicella metallireducens AeB TaxID=1403537 RepID=A0A017RYC9_9CLOT|nr:hypothetical protein [Fervidicella metallireducens]EYE88945.1 hypothetical protein Q428_05180 [Fervidicella metallireducens AeB]
MKKKTNKDIILFIIILPLFLYLAFYLLNSTENNLPYYSVINKGRMGCSVFYKGLKKLNYPVKRSIETNKYDIQDVQLIAENRGFDVNNSDIKEWISKGGILVYLVPNNLAFIEYGEKIENKVDLTIYKYGKGKIITFNVLEITNINLGKSTEGAYELLRQIDKNKQRNIVFNEYYMFANLNPKTLWDFIPLGAKFIIYQIIIIIAAFFYYKGKRFGKAVPIYEEVERVENEYLYASGALLRQAECWDAMFDIFYKVFIKELNPPDENWLEYWRKLNLADIDKAEELYRFISKIDVKTAQKEYKHIVYILEQLTNTLKQRRDGTWKIYKGTI